MAVPSLGDHGPGPWVLAWRLGVTPVNWTARCLYQGTAYGQHCHWGIYRGRGIVDRTGVAEKGEACF